MYDAAFRTRFWAKVDVGLGPLSCWLWRGATLKNGNGVVHVRCKPKTMARAYRVCWELQSGKALRPNVALRRTCGTTGCIQPGHRALVRLRPRKGQPRVFTADEVRRMRALYLSGAARQVELARRFQCAPSTVSNIATFKHWRHAA